MSNLDFYAAGSDFVPVIEFVMNGAACAVFETYSAPERPLRQFHTPGEILAELSRSPSLGLMLYSSEMRGRTRIRRYDFKEKKTAPTSWRETIEGWGLIQLELRAPSGTTLSPSHTNHNSRERAMKWSTTYLDFPPVAEWAFDVVTRISRSINQHIRKLSVAKTASRPILGEANGLLEGGRISLAAV
jgi:hypothetical protein